jgi:hypothetical protein
VVPPEIFTCARQPKHSRRGRQNTPEERVLLEKIGRKLAQMEQSKTAANQDAPETEAGASSQELPGGVQDAGAGVLGQSVED